MTSGESQPLLAKQVRMDSGLLNLTIPLAIPTGVARNEHKKESTGVAVFSFMAFICMMGAGIVKNGLIWPLPGQTSVLDHAFKQPAELLRQVNTSVTVSNFVGVGLNFVFIIGVHVFENKVFFSNLSSVDSLEVALRWLCLLLLAHNSELTWIHSVAFVPICTFGSAVTTLMLGDLYLKENERVSTNGLFGVGFGFVGAAAVRIFILDRAWMRKLKASVWDSQAIMIVVGSLYMFPGMFESSRKNSYRPLVKIETQFLHDYVNWTRHIGGFVVGSCLALILQPSELAPHMAEVCRFMPGERVRISQTGETGTVLGFMAGGGDATFGGPAPLSADCWKILVDGHTEPESFLPEDLISILEENCSPHELRAALEGFDYLKVHSSAAEKASGDEFDLTRTRLFYYSLSAHLLQESLGRLDVGQLEMIYGMSTAKSVHVMSWLRGDGDLQAQVCVEPAGGASALVSDISRAFGPKQKAVDLMVEARLRGGSGLKLASLGWVGLGLYALSLMAIRALVFKRATLDIPE